MKQPHKKVNSLDYLRGDKEIKSRLSISETFIPKEEEPKEEEPEEEEIPIPKESIQKGLG